MKKAILLVLPLILVSSVAAGSENGSMPHLGDHVFVPNMALSEPFINTHIQTTVSLGKTQNAIVPVIDITEDTILRTTEADLMLAGIGFKYQHQVKDWLAAGLNMDVSGRIGTNTPSLVSEGVTGAVSYEVGWLLRMFRSEKILLSGSLGLGNTNATFINLLSWVDGILEDDPVKLVQGRQSVRGIGGLHAAWGLSRRFGFLGALDFSYGEAFDVRTGNSWNHDGRLGVSYDLAFDLGLPLGLALTGGHFDNFKGSGTEDGVWLWSARLAIQSRKDFTIGFDFQTTYLTRTATDKTYRLGQFSIDMRYYY